MSKTVMDAINEVKIAWTTFGAYFCQAVKEATCTFFAPLVKVLAWVLDKCGRSKMIYRLEDGKLKPYLKRHYLFRTRPFAIFIHQFWSGDTETQFLHDHPFPFGNIILAGGYYEIMLRDCNSVCDDIITFRRPVGYCKPKRRGEELHRVLLKPGTEGKVWTIFWRWKKYRRWGFFTDAGWIDAEEFLKVKNDYVEID